MAAYCAACKKSSHRGSDHAPGSRLGGGTQEVTSLRSFLTSLFTDFLSVLPCSPDNDTIWNDWESLVLVGQPGEHNTQVGFVELLWICQLFSF